MIYVVRSGKEKTYFEHCSRCGTDMTYKLEDVREKKVDGNFSMTFRSIICPVCGEEFGAPLQTEEEKKLHAYHQSYFYGNCTMGGNGDA